MIRTQTLNKYDAFIGHIPARFFHFIDNYCFFTFTILREPSSRVLSLYRSLHNFPEAARARVADRSMLDMIYRAKAQKPVDWIQTTLAWDAQAYILDNCCRQFTLGYDVRDIWEKISPEAALAAATKFLEGLTFVGIYEEMENTAKIISAKIRAHYGLAPAIGVEIPHLNVSAPAEISTAALEEVRTYIQKRNPLDVQLYEVASKMFRSFHQRTLGMDTAFAPAAA